MFSFHSPLMPSLRKQHLFFADTHTFLPYALANCPKQEYVQAFQRVQPKCLIHHPKREGSKVKLDDGTTFTWRDFFIATLVN